MKRKLWSSLAVLCLAAPLGAYASEGYVVDNVNLRAGPDPSYPLVDQLPSGTEVDVQGCTDGWEWCDVINEGDGSRGWIAGNYIQYQYQDQEVLLPDYGAQIGIPIVAFSIGAYWDRYYRSRPFYGQRGDWYRRPYVSRPPSPPSHGPYQGRPGEGRPNGNYGGRPGSVYDPNREGHPGPVGGPAYPVRQVQNGRPVQPAPGQGRPQPAKARPAPHDDDHHDDNGH